VAATNQSLKQEMQNGNFREDLFYRLNVFPIRMPSLVERKDDIVGLSRYFLEQLGYPHTDLAAEVKDLFMRYDWPGNIRELKNVLERAVILSGGEPLTVDEFSLEIDDRPLVAGNSAGAVASSGLESAEKQMILDALEKAGGNKTEAARLLKITRRRLYSRMKAHGISN
jgi:two-component system response regulator HydG